MSGRTIEKVERELAATQVKLERLRKMHQRALTKLELYERPTPYLVNKIMSQAAPTSKGL
jgi:hypothetical protein